MRIDHIREKLAIGRLCFGTHCSATEPWHYEMCGFLDEFKARDSEANRG